MKSLRNQLLIIFLGFVLISVVTAIFTTYYFKEKEAIISTSQLISRIEIDLLKGLKEQENYYNFESVNAVYFQTKKSDYLTKYSDLYSGLLKQIRTLENKDWDSLSANKLNHISTRLEDFDALFRQIVLSIHKRGFKSYGIEGEMREAIHALEEIEELDLKQILMLRRHEKDFIIRQEQSYLEQHDHVLLQLKKEIKKSTTLKKDRKEEIRSTLKRYSRLFDEVVLYERMIGLKSNTGLKKKLNSKANQLLSDLNQFNDFASMHQNRLEYGINAALIVFWVIYLVVAIFLSFHISKKFTKRLNTLSNRISYFVNTNFSSRLKLQPKNRKDEVGQLWNNFIKMEREIVEYIELFKEKVDEKTLELSYKSEKIELQKQEILAQKEESDKKNKDLLDGMRYGWRIQRALLPTVTRFKKHVDDGFVFFAPKDIVSGDIYWTHKSKRKRQEEVIFSVIDCTGHGVPGAFMSILAVNAINYGVLNKGYVQPAKILKTTNNYVFNTMKYYNTGFNNYQTKDGMDMLLCKLNRTELTLEYSGANRSLFIVRAYQNESSKDIGLEKGEYKMIQQPGVILFEIISTKNTVGTLNEKESKLFKNKELKVHKGDMLYLSSDGYADQFGGPKNKKFMISRVKNMLMLIHELKAEEQKNVLKQTFLDWKEGEEQVDDITILGVRV